jgi:DNA polymerase elongation subunit (family B)
MTFSSLKDIDELRMKLRGGLYVQGLNKCQYTIHESNADPILQLCCNRNIPTSGWIKFKGRRVKNKKTLCDHEFNVSWLTLEAEVKNKVPNPLIMSFDIEVNSSNVNMMPCASKKGDEIFQISCVLSRQGDPESKFKKYLLTLGEPDQSVVGEDVVIQTYKKEMHLLEGYTNFIKTHNPNIIAGYNIIGFDMQYMIERAKTRMCIHTFDKQGFIPDIHSRESTIKWSSSAYGNQEFQFLDAEGRLFVDLLPLVKRDYKMDNYKLKTISEYFIGETKDPLSHKGIFHCYRMGTKKTNGVFGKGAKKYMGIVGKYCVQDSVLVTKLLETLQIWIGLTEMAKVCNVPIFTLYTQGQQVKVFSQVYKKCLDAKIVVIQNGYVTKEDEQYQGAYVIDPIPGVYDKVVPFDFASLYPSTIISKNICWSTLVIDEKIPDSMCHVIEWEDHVGCSHDTTVRKTAPKNTMCAKRRYRFIKEPMGILPSMLSNLLLSRKNVKKEIKDIKKKIKEDTSLTPKEKQELETFTVILDKRQLSYKVSANSAYGALGVREGRLPFMPGAMCTTAVGRESVRLAGKTIVENYKGVLIYGDTDSCYVRFPHLDNAPIKELWDYSTNVAKEVSKLFPEAMTLEFEEVIYWVFFILTKKRYMSLKCDRDGVVSQTIEKKGVLLARRDNSRFTREVYSDIVMRIFHRENEKDIEYALIDHINKLFSRYYQSKWFVVTKSVKSTGLLMSKTDYITEKNEEIVKSKGKPKYDNSGKVMTRWTCKIGDYKAPLLHPTDEKKRKEQMNKKMASDEHEYYERCLPAQVQLAMKMARRGQRVDPGTRIEYVITTDFSSKSISKAKQWEKIESIDYFNEHSNVLNIDPMYYLNSICNPMDQALGIVHNLKQLTLQQYKIRMNKIKVNEDIRALFKTKIRIYNN